MSCIIWTRHESEDQGEVCVLVHGGGQHAKQDYDESLSGGQAGHLDTKYLSKMYLENISLHLFCDFKILMME